MEFEDILREQIRMHPSMEAQDFIKLCFQASFGAEHLLSDIELARQYFDTEYEGVSKNKSPLYEQISDDVYRINLAPWKRMGLPQNWLFQMFVLTSNTESNSKGSELFYKYLDITEEMINSADLNFTIDDWLAYKEDYLREGIKPVHHSENYRSKENPSYRIVSNEMISLIPLLVKIKDIDNLEEGIVVATEGHTASEKAIIKTQLKKIIEKI